jgi:two-component system, OmpR family, sensor histidine kinase MprB
VTLRRRLAVMCALAVGVTLVLAAVACYAAMRSELRAQVDRPLVAQGELIQRRGLRLGQALPALPRRAGGAAEFSRVVPDPGGGGTPSFSDRTIDGIHARVLTVPVPGLGEVQIGRSLDGVDAVLSRLRIVLALLVVAGVGFAAVLARVFARPVIRPISELTRTAEHIEVTGDLGRRIGAHGTDEVGRMAQRFDAMLDRVQTSQATQQRLVADASHALRTPVTALRTNTEVLLAGAELEEGERRALLRDMVGESEQLSALVGDLIDLARGDEGEGPVEDLGLDTVVADAVARVPAGDVRFALDLAPCVVRADPERLGRAVANLLDNAAAHSPPGGVVEVGVRDGTLSVRDHGAGVADEELPQLFDRFFRGASERGRRGSGLGLALVRQVAESCGGSVDAENAPGGGLVVRLVLPTQVRVP